jgi:hypothetical protein
MKALKTLLASLVIVAFLGCATNPNKISAQYVSPLIYKDYTDDQIISEMDHVGRRTNELYMSLAKEAKADKWQTGIGIVIFWPALFLLEGGDGPEAVEYARLKGEYEALRQNAIQRRIGLNKLPPSPEEILKAKKKEKK